MWAPLEDAPDTELSVYVEYAPGAACPGCGRLVAGHYCVGAFVPHLASYPEFQFARVGGFRRRPNWYQPMLQAVWSRVREQVNVTLRSDAGACSWCSGPLAEAAPTGAQKPAERLSCTVQLKDLPAPRFGTVERDWLRRWAVLDA